MRSKRKHGRDGEGTKFTLDRKIFSSDIWHASPWKLKVWIYLIGHANHKNSTVMGVPVKRGQLIRSYRKIAEDCSYRAGFRTKKPSLDTVKRVCDALEIEGRIIREIVKTNKQEDFSRSSQSTVRIERKNAKRTERNTTLFIVCNYNDLQTFPEPRTEQQGTVRTEQDKNVIKVSKDTLQSKVPILGGGKRSDFQKFDSDPRRKGEHEAGGSSGSNGKGGKESSSKKKRETSEANPEVRIFIVEWCEVWFRKFGKPYMPNWGKEGKLVKDLLRVYSLDELRDLRAEFFRSDRLFIQNSGYSIGIFRSVINDLVADLARDPTEQARRETAKLKEEDEKRL